MKLKQFLEFANSLQPEFIEKAEIKMAIDSSCFDCGANGDPEDITMISVTNRGNLLLHDNPALGRHHDDYKLIAAVDMNREYIWEENKRRMKLSKEYRKAFGDSY